MDVNTIEPQVIQKKVCGKTIEIKPLVRSNRRTVKVKNSNLILSS